MGLPLQGPRTDFGVAQRSGDYDEAAVEEAYKTMLFAEGSDWFWWYGADQDSGDDGYFDRAYRELLGQVYDTLGIERPTFVAIPIVPQAAVDPDYGITDLVTIAIDNEVATHAGLKGAATNPRWRARRLS